LNQRQQEKPARGEEAITDQQSDTKMDAVTRSALRSVASRQPVGTTESDPMAGPRSFVGEVRLAFGRIFASAKEAPIRLANLG
jgi:hypothetical protein